MAFCRCPARAWCVFFGNRKYRLSAPHTACDIIYIITTTYMQYRATCILFLCDVLFSFGWKKILAYYGPATHHSSIGRDRNNLFYSAETTDTNIKRRWRANTEGLSPWTSSDPSSLLPDYGNLCVTGLANTRKFRTFALSPVKTCVKCIEQSFWNPRERVKTVFLKKRIFLV